MADTMQFDLVSPERRLASVEASEVHIPGADGDMTAMPDHVPVITTLRPGILGVTHAGGTDEYVVSGGFAEVSATSVSVLAEEAMPKAELTQEVLDRLMGTLKEAQAHAEQSGSGDDAAKLVADMAALGASLGLTAS